MSTKMTEGQDLITPSKDNHRTADSPPSLSTSEEDGSVPKLKGGEVLTHTGTYETCRTDGFDDKEAAYLDPSEDAYRHHLGGQHYDTNVDVAAREADILLQNEAMAANVQSGRWKLDLRIVPALMLLWLANFIDRSNAGNARIAGLDKDLKLVGRQFNIGLAVFYISYILIELPSNLVLKKIGGNHWLPLITAAWGLITALTAACTNFSGFAAVRFFLGMAEGGLLPGMSLYLSFIYPRHSLQRRIAAFYSAASLAGSFGGLLATGLTRIETGKVNGWRWLYLCEGLGTVAFALIAWLLLPKDISKAKYLNDDERHALLEIKRHDNSSSYRSISTLVQEARRTNALPADVDLDKLLRVEKQVHQHQQERFEWFEVRRAVTSFQTWATGITYLCLCNSLYSFTLFLPTILQGIYPGSAQTKIQLLTVPVFVPAAAMVLIVAYLSDRAKKRGPFIMGLLPISMLGYILLIASANPRVNYAGVFILALGIYPSAPCIIALINNNSAPHVKRASSVAMQLMIANCAGFIATFIYDKKFAPRYITPHWVVLASLILGWVSITANVFYCWNENRARAAGKRDGNVTEYLRLVSQGKTQAPLGDRDPFFRYTL